MSNELIDHLRTVASIRRKPKHVHECLPNLISDLLDESANSIEQYMTKVSDLNRKITFVREELNTLSKQLH
jgi:hypothetical protein